MGAVRSSAATSATLWYQGRSTAATLRCEFLTSEGRPSLTPALRLISRRPPLARPSSASARSSELASAAAGTLYSMPPWTRECAGTVRSAQMTVLLPATARTPTEELG